jgi:hypothetical protein
MNETVPLHTQRPARAVPQAAPRVALSRQGEEIMRAVAPVILGPLLPAEHTARAAALEAGIASLDDYLAYLSLPLQKEARFLFGVLALLPVRLLLVGTWSRWPAVAPQRLEAFLRRARQSRFFLLRRIHAFLQSMAVLAWFDLPAAWDEIGYPGPPIERPVRTGDPW